MGPLAFGALVTDDALIMVAMNSGGEYSKSHPGDRCMMAPKITVPYTTPLIYRPVFDIWFSDERYRHWKNNKNAKWQLRCVGGPGSGKTQFSSLVAQDLQREYKGKNIAIVSIFLSEATNRLTPCIGWSSTTMLLAEVQRQLKTAPHDLCQNRILSGTDSGQGQLAHLRIKDENIDELRQTVVSERSSYEQAFILVDDLDIVRNDPEEYSRFEEELARLQRLDFKIFTTSRVPFKPNPLVGCCDVHGTEDKLVEGSDDPVNIWWECPTCIDDGEDEYYICDECFTAGYRCKDAAHKDVPLVQKRDRVDLDIGSPPLANFVKHQLESTHGDLGLQSQVNLRPEERRSFPPPSPLGRALQAPANQADMEERINALIDETGDNITIALLRLENISLGETIDVVGAQADRMPRNIVASFDAAIDHIMSKQDDLRRILGIKAIQIVGKSGHMAGIPLCELRDRILEGWSSSEESGLRELLDSEYSLEELLSATNGFLQVRFNPGEEEPYIECFHQDFDIYVAEDYGNTLVTYSLPVAKGLEQQSR